MQRNTNIPIDFKLAGQLALNAIDAYLSGQHLPVADRYGFYHGSNGRRRACKLRGYIENIDSNQTITLLAVYLALFGKPDMWTNVGYSGLLAGMIADRWITGNYQITIGMENEPSTLESKVFTAPQMINEVKDDFRNFRSIAYEGGGVSYFDQTQGVRSLLQKLILKLKPEEQRQVAALAAQLKENLDDSTETIIHRLLPSSLEVEERKRGGALIGSFLGQDPEEPDPDHKKFISEPAQHPFGKLPPGVLSHVASFLPTHRQFVRVNKAAHTLASKKPAPFSAHRAPLHFFEEDKHSPFADESFNSVIEEFLADSDCKALAQEAHIPEAADAVKRKCTRETLATFDAALSKIPDTQVYQSNPPMREKFDRFLARLQKSWHALSLKITQYFSP